MIVSVFFYFGWISRTRKLSGGEEKERRITRVRRVFILNPTKVRNEKNHSTLSFAKSAGKKININAYFSRLHIVQLIIISYMIKNITILRLNRFAAFGFVSLRILLQYYIIVFFF